MQNNNPFSRDSNPDLTRTIHAVVNQKPINLNEAVSPEAIVSKYNKMKDADDPNEAAMLLANFLQNKKAIKCLLLAKQIRELEKTMPEEIKDRKTDGFNVVDILKYTARWRSYLWRDFAMKYPQVTSKQFTEACWRGYTAKGLKRKGGRMIPNCVPVTETAAWTRAAGKNPEGGLNQKGRNSYNKENPGSNLKPPVTTPPSKLKPGSKSANRRKSFCARMGGMQGAMRDENGKPTRKALALRKWNC